MRPQLRISPTPYPRLSNTRLSSNRQALAFLSEIVEDIVYMKPRIRMNRLYEYEPYEYDKGIYLLDVASIKGSVEIDRGAEDDLLVSNFWAMLLGFLRDTYPSDVVDTSGNGFNLRASGDVNAATAYLVYGTSTISPTFTDNVLKSYSGSISTSISMSYLSDRTRVILSGILTGTAYELGIYQLLFDTSSNTRTCLLARMVGSWSANQVVNYNIDFLSPWVKQVGDLIYGIFRNADVNTQRIDGTTITLRSSGDANASSSYLVLSSGAVSWTPLLYYVPSAVTPTNYYFDIFSTRSIRMTVFNGLIAPSNDIQINTLGLYQLVYDSGGVTHTVCWLVLPLSSSITLYAARNNLVILRIIAM
jgi:hypothetical protein